MKEEVMIVLAVPLRLIFIKAPAFRVAGENPAANACRAPPFS
jgi:hypothetical protein